MKASIFQISDDVLNGMIPFDSIFDAYQWCDVTWHQNWIIDLGLIWTTKIQKLLKIILVQFLEWMIKCGYNHLYIGTLNFLSFKKKQRLSNFSRVRVKWGHTTFWIGLILIFIEPEKSYQSSWFLSFLSWKTERISKNSRTLLDSIHKVEVKSKTQKVNWGQMKFDV